MSPLYSLFAAVLLVQSAYSQCLNYGSPQVLPAQSSIGLGSSCNGGSLSSNTHASNQYSCNSNAGIQVNQLGNIASNQGYNTLSIGSIPANGGETLIVYSGSANTPQGLSISSENELYGTVTSSGTLPFAAAIAVNGNLASGGTAAVNYASAPGAQLLEGGCGLGLAGAGGYSSIGGSNYGGSFSGGFQSNAGYLQPINSGNFGGSIISSGCQSNAGYLPPINSGSYGGNGCECVYTY